ncbi:MAG: hypothetical protein LUI85_07350 [Bacteroides sp.]|nr:hypothetical protein [Bacteroides sp.]
MNGIRKYALPPKNKRSEKMPSLFLYLLKEFINTSETTRSHTDRLLRVPEEEK